MPDSDERDAERTRLEIEVEPSVAGRLARWAERARVLRSRVEAARAGHASVDVGFHVVELDSSIGGGLRFGANASSAARASVSRACSASRWRFHMLA